MLKVQASVLARQERLEMRMERMEALLEKMLAQQQGPTWM